MAFPNRFSHALKSDLTQCDGQHPTCSLCEKRLTKCEYDGDGASRRLGNLRRLNNELTDKIQTYEAQISLLRNTTNAADVQGMVEKLRTAGEDMANTIAASRHVVERPTEETSPVERSEGREDALLQVQ